MDTYSKIKNINVFKDISEADLRVVANVCRSRKCRKDEIIFEEKSRGKELYLIYEGSVGLEISQYDSSEFHKFCTLPSNEVVGDLAFIDNIERSSRAVSIQDQELFYVDRDDLYNCLEDHPSMGYHFMKNLCELISKRLRLTNNIVKSTLGSH